MKNSAQSKKLYINTKKQLKIWFSVEQEVFLPPENILRFIETILMHKDSQFTFIYSSELLNEQAIIEMHKFAKIYDVRVLDIRDIINIQNQEDEYIIIVKQVLENLKQTKSLPLTALLSDLIRPIVDEGIYTDYDNTVDLRSLKEWHEVKSPFILNIDSKIISKDSSYHYRSITINNDFFALAHKESKESLTQETIEIVTKIKHFIISKFKEFNEICLYFKKNGKLPENLSSFFENNLNSSNRIHAKLVKTIFLEYINSTNEFSLPSFIAYFDTNLKPSKIHEILGENETASLFGYYKEIGKANNLDDVYFRLKNLFILSPFVSSIAGPKLYQEFFYDSFKEEDNLLRYEKKTNNLEKIIKTREEDRADLSWLRSPEKKYVLFSSKSVELFKTTTMKNVFNGKYHFPIESINSEDPYLKRYLYAENIKFACHELFKSFKENQEELVDIRQWYTGDQINNLLHIHLNDDNFYIAPQTQNRHLVVADNIANAISHTLDGQISLVPILMGNHWVSLALRQNTHTNILDVVFVDSLGHQFSYYDNNVIIETINSLTNGNFNFIDLSSFTLGQQTNNNDCGVWTVDNLINIALYMFNHPVFDVNNLAEDLSLYLNIGNANTLRNYHQLLLTAPSNNPSTSIENPVVSEFLEANPLPSLTIGISSDLYKLN